MPSLNWPSDRWNQMNKQRSKVDGILEVTEKALEEG